MGMPRTRPATQAPVWDPLVLWSSLMDLPRQQAAVATHAACAMFSGFEALRAVQQRAAQQALERHGAAAQRLERPCGPLDVLSVQADLARYDLEAAAAYWQQLAQAALQMQAGIAACGCELVDTEKLLEACALFEKR